MSELMQLIDGYRRFRYKGWARERERWADMAEGQSPQVMILSCADRRAAPAPSFAARPGGRFVVRRRAGPPSPCATPPAPAAASPPRAGSAAPPAARPPP